MSCNATVAQMRATNLNDQSNTANQTNTEGQQQINDQLKLTMIVVGGFIGFLIIVLLIRLWIGHKISVRVV